jgi:hypothetical protein
MDVIRRSSPGRTVPIGTSLWRWLFGGIYGITELYHRCLRTVFCIGPGRIEYDAVDNCCRLATCCALNVRELGDSVGVFSACLLYFGTRVHSFHVH